ncbi:hypothetical protein B0F90DRAFT_1819818 [Multifurca ochricompacta]|uniref:NACHT domain-containing protein n=1 Tax=Multifurca ochricompacta TaxID=376703 RepID=A0AAD4M0E4_9AGAM|nr:hypothetical protein B0F90DRAFT_1819818 [Multifurca ochricompacta]
MSSSPLFDLPALFDTALNEYEKQAGTNLVEHQLAIKLKSCHSTDSVITILQEQANEFLNFRGSDGKVMKWLKRIVQVLHTLSTNSVLGEGVGLPFPPAKAVFAGIGILLSAIKDVSRSYDALADLFESMENFLRRLDIYTKIPSTAAMTETIVKILIELLSTLALATRQIQQGRLKKLGKKLLGENDVEAILQRLDRLTHEEARTTVAQTLEVVYGLVKNMKVVMDDGKASTSEIRQSLAVMQQIASELNKSKRDQLQKDVRSWLSPPDPSKNHNIACETHHEGTATWFIEGKAFSDWKKAGSLLWVHGKPGSGKSVLCSMIIQDIEVIREAGLASMAVFYFDFRDDAKQNSRGLLSSLLFQLCAQSDRCSGILSRLYSSHVNGFRQPSDSALMHCLEEVLTVSGQCTTYIIMDGLDECPKTSGTPSAREKVLRIVKELVCLRHPNLRFPLHDEAGQMEDINNYISFFMNSDTNTRRWRKDDKELVINKLCQQADGMFRWIFCQLDTLRRCLPGRIRPALDELPGTLDETYERALQDIDETNWEYAYRLFQCVVGIFPTLEAGWRPENPGDAVLSTCSSLITVVKVDGSPVVQFTHFSVKEFLTSNRLTRGPASRYYIPLKSAHLIVAQACLAVLLQLDENININNIKDVPLALYAARYWADHAQFENLSSYLEDAMKRLFDPKLPHFAVCVWIHSKDRDKGSQSMISDSPSRPAESPLYHAALYNLAAVAEWLVTERSQNVDERGGEYQTALHAVSAMGCTEVARVLLENGADVNIQGVAEWTPLHYASDRGHAGVLRLLLKFGAEVNNRTPADRIPLLLGSEEGHLEVVRALLEHGADPNTWRLQTRTPLYRALEQGHFAVAQLLLENGADVNARNDNGWTLLHVASNQGNLEVVRLLLERGANVQARNKLGRTPFQEASEMGHSPITELLSGSGAGST